MGLILPDDDEEARLLQRYAGNPVGTERMDAVTPRSWWDDTYDAGKRTLTDPNELLKLGVGANPAANIAMAAPDIAEGGAGLARDIWHGDIDASRRHALQLGMGGFALAPFGGTIAREVKPILQDAARTAARGAEHAVAPEARRIAAQTAEDVRRLSPSGETLSRDLPSLLTDDTGLPAGLRPGAAPRVQAATQRVEQGAQDARDLRASKLSESLLSDTPAPEKATGTDTLSAGLLSPAKDVQRLYKQYLSNMDTGVRGSAGGGTAGTGSGRAGTLAAVPSLRDQSLPDAIKQAESGVHVIPKPDGGYVGAPAAIRNDADLAAQRAAFDAKVKAGAPGGDWYERVRGWLKEVSGKDPILGRQLAEELGLFSPQSDPNTNLLFGLQASDAHAAGRPLKIVRTGQQAERFNETRDAQIKAFIEGKPIPAMPQGDKTGVFEGHMDWTRPGGTTGTNDIWHARALGYADPDGNLWSSGLSASQHQWMDHETVLAVKRANDAKIGGRDNWTAAEIQAAPWVAGKAEDLAKRYKIPLKEGMDRAIATYPDFASRYTGTFPVEQEPFVRSGIGRGSMSPEEYAKAANWDSPVAGQDVMSRVIGQHTQKSVPGTGVYTPEGGATEYNPLSIGRPMIGFQKSPGDLAAGDAARAEAARLNVDREALDREFGYKTPSIKAVSPPDKDPRVIPEYTQASLGGAQAVRGTMDFQGGSPWHIIDTQSPGADANSLKIMTKKGKPPSPEQMQQLEAIAGEHGFTLSNTGDGVSFINFDPHTKQYEPYAEGGPKIATDPGRSGGAVARELKAGLQAKIDAVLPGNTTQRGRYHGDYIDLADQLDASNQGKGLATSVMLDRLRTMHDQSPAAFQRMIDAPELAAKAKANLARLEATGQTGKRPDYENLLRLISEGRMRGLLQRVQKEGVQGLPAAIGAGGLGGAAAGSQLPGLLDDREQRG